MIARFPFLGPHSPGPGGAGSGDDGDGERGASKEARVLPFDPKVRERLLQQRVGAQAKAKPVSPGGVKGSHTVRFRVYRVFEVAGILFALFVFFRSCGVGF